MTSAARVEVREQFGEPRTKECVEQSQIKSEKCNGDQYYDRRADNFLLARPRDLFHLVADIEVKLLATS